MGAELWVNDAGTARKLKEIWVNDAGTARKLKEVWANVGGVARQIFGKEVDLGALPSPVLNFAAGAAEVDLFSSGRILVSGVSASLTDVGPWLTGGGSAANYDVFVTVTAGTLQSGPIDSWVNLGTTRAWTKGAANGTIQQCTIGIQIRRASDQVVLASGSVTLICDKSGIGGGGGA